MPNIAKLATGLTAIALTVAMSPVAAADPTIPLDPAQLPGLEAVQNLSPVVQQAAADPGSAQQLLLAAASQLAGNATTPEGSLSLAQAVTRFVQEGGAAGLAPAAQVTDQAATGLAHGTAPLLTPGPGNGPIPLEQHVPAAGVVPGAEAHLPFGGNGLSGNGSRQSGIWVLDQFTRWQSMNWDYSGKLQKAQMDVAELPFDPDFRL